MKNMSLENIAAACGGVYYGSETDKQKEVQGVAIDSRKIQADWLFIPIRGARVDGHDFIPAVMNAGAACCLSEQELPDIRPYILVHSCEQALKNIAAFYRSVLDVTVIGITGSVGKTSTKEMIASVLSQKYKVLKTKGNFNNEIGLPLTIFELQESDEIAVLEMGISDFGEMRRLAYTARPDLCVITNIGPCHLEQLGDLSGVLRAKTEIFEFLKKDGRIFLNGDDPTLNTVAPVRGIQPFRFGLGPDSDIYADEVQSLGLAGTSCRIHIHDRHLAVTIPIPGDHMVYNALAGAALGAALGLSDAEIVQGIAQLKPTGGRNNLVRTDSLTILDDCYNANPVSMKASIDVVAAATTRRICILGSMGELGAEERLLHYETGVYAASRNIDTIICIGELAAEIARGAREAGSDSVIHYNEKKEFLADVPKLLEKGDTVLIKASHFMGFEELVTALAETEL